MYALPTSLQSSDKKDVLLALLRGYEEHLLHISSSSSTMTITICSGLIALPILIAEKVQTLPVWSNVALSVILGLVALMTISAILRNASHYRWLCQAITRVKQTLGLFEEKLYFDRSLFSSAGYKFWFDGDAIMPKQSQDWGGSFAFTSDAAYCFAILASYAGSLVILWGKAL